MNDNLLRSSLSVEVKEENEAVEAAEAAEDETKT